MPLKHSLSKLFHKAPDNRTPYHDALPVPTSTPAIPTTINEAQEDEHAVFTATVNSLKEENAHLATRAEQNYNQILHVASQQTQELDQLRELVGSQNIDITTLHTNVWEAQRTIAQLQVNLQASQEQVSKIENEKAELRRDIQVLRQDLRLSNEQLIESGRRAHATASEQTQKIQRLENQLLNRHGHAAESIERPRAPISQVAEERRNDQNADERRIIAELQTKIASMDQQIDSLQQEAQQVASAQLDQVSSLRSGVTILEAELRNANAQNDDAEAITEALQSDINSLLEEMEEMKMRQSKLIALLGDSLTPRMILALVADKRFPRLQPDAHTGTETMANPARFLQTYKIEDLETRFLDTKLRERTQLTSFCESIAAGSRSRSSIDNITFSECPKCNISRISAVETVSPRRRGLFGLLSSQSRQSRNGALNEFPTAFRQNICPDMLLCSACLVDALKTSLADNWWYELDCQSWLKCPMGNCDRYVQIQDVDAVGEVLRGSSEKQIMEFKAMFSQALKLRDALASLNPMPDLDALSVAASLHKQLIAFDLMHDFFGDNEQAPPYEVGEVMLGRIDRGNLTIPIFTKLFKIPAMDKDCIICAESYREIEFGSEQEWATAYEGFEGPWVSKLNSFPTKVMQHCEHSLDVCKKCYNRHLDEQLTQNARSPEGAMSCPECRRTLEDDEIRALASDDTLQRLDKCLLLQHLATESGFRWCLRPSCNNGDLYDEDDYMDPHIRCSECQFEMCFTHQTPWHDGMSCDHYESQRAHGDPDYAKTQKWLRTNTKNCPGQTCGVSIQKGDACFHMTCSTCRHEFCWVCLADYSLISPRPGDYVQSAHNEGCLFLTLGLQPTQVQGSNLESALRQRQRS